MRMRQKPWVKDYLKEDHPVILNDPAEHKGHFRELLQREEIHVEIGSGKGDYWLKMAEMHPECGWIAIEKEINCVAVATRKAEQTQLDNILLIPDDAAKIDTWFEKGEIDCLHLNFSDPWPKNRNRKRRLTHENFTGKYAELLKDDGTLCFKTDNTKLFEFTLVAMDQNWQLTEVSLDYDSEAEGDALTEYESRFRSEGVPIKRAVFQKRVSQNRAE